MSGEAAAAVLQLTLRTMAAQNRLLQTAAGCTTASQLVFHILNHTIELLPYDRAVLLDAPTGKVRAVSGTSQHDTRSGLAGNWRQFAQTLMKPVHSAHSPAAAKPSSSAATGQASPPSTAPAAQSAASANSAESASKSFGGARILQEEDFPESLRESWRSHCEALRGGSILWLPLHEKGPVLWLERWNGAVWRDSERDMLLPLAGGYGNLLRLHASRKEGRSILGLARMVQIWIVAALLLLIPVRLRIVAPCEVVPAEPAAIAARIDGVVKKVAVRPGELVKKGQTLVRLEPEVIQEEFNSAQQSYREAGARYISARAQAVRDPDERAQLPELTNRLRQEKARLSMAQYRVDNLSIVAPLAGVAILSNPDEWAGRPVQVGERILQVADPKDSRVRVYLPQHDNIDFPSDAEVRVLLSNDSAVSREAVLKRISAQAVEHPGTGSCFPAEAEWTRNSDSGKPLPALGVSGTAVLYGERVPLGYWLLRKPLAALRNYLGI